MFAGLISILDLTTDASLSLSTTNWVCSSKMLPYNHTRPITQNSAIFNHWILTGNTRSNVLLSLLVDFLSENRY